MGVEKTLTKSERGGARSSGLRRDSSGPQTEPPSSSSDAGTGGGGSSGEWEGDLRRRRRQEGVERLVSSARYLPPGERVLIESVFRDGRRVSELARLISGLRPSPSRLSPENCGPRAEFPSPSAIGAGRALRYRVRRVVRRMLSPEYQAVARWLALDKVNDHSALSPRDSGLGAWSGWSATRRRVAVCCGLHGRSLREAASDLGVSLHTVRRHWDAVKALVDAAMPPRARRGEHAE